MPKELDYDALRKTLEDALHPLKESVAAMSTELFALRKCINEGDFGELDGKIKKADDVAARCRALLDWRMESFERRLFSYIDARLGDRRQGRA